MISRMRFLAAVALVAASPLVVSGDQVATRDWGATSTERGCESMATQVREVDASERRGILVAQMSCRDCEVRRDRCHTGCNSLSTSREQLQCVNRCNSDYPCVQGSDCR